jgi:copper chaperone CopZ
MDQKITINVEGMSCQYCVDFVAKLISKNEGIRSCDVSLSEKKAHVSYDENIINKDLIIQQINETEIYEASI